jgi:hypothetical protein
MNLGYQSLPETSFGSFEPMELDIFFPMSFSISLSKVSHITLILQVSNFNFDSSDNLDNERWTLVTHKKGMKKGADDKANYNKNLDGKKDN